MKLSISVVACLIASCTHVLAGSSKPSAVAAPSKTSNPLTIRVRLTDGSVKRVQAAPSDSVEDVCEQLDCDIDHGVATDAELTTSIDCASTLQDLAIGHGDWLYLRKDPSEKARDNSEIIKRMKKKRARELKGGGVIECQTLAKLDQELKDAGNALVVVDFYADWCGPCKQIAPKYKAMADEFPKAVLLKVNVDTNKDASERYDVSSMPTFVFIKNGKVLHTMKGADENGLKDKIRTYSS